MWIRKKEIEQLSEFVKGFISGEEADIRDNKEGAFSILKNDIYSLVNTKNEQIKTTEAERNILAEYMADISHQLKTPITSMMIMADLLEDAEPEKRSEFIHNIKLSLNKLEWLVGALLKMAKLDAHAITFSKKDVKVSELIEAVKPFVNILLDINNQTLELANDCVINCDKRWTVEALTNIIKNAIEHSPNESKIELNCGENPMYYWISVKDSGAGMNRSSYSALFKRFEYSTTENGFGIGMPLALSIVKGQGGDIDIDFGGNGQGTTFTLKLFK
ncbi:MAG: HAMP domain-containing sensor histidine kinase [Lachnospiraceae bacterium]|nr:HAMP domain-containing sensor histidine kinase [Lachnospiraceae bacterium]